MTKNEEVTKLSSGVKAIIRPVPAFLVDKMTSKIKMPKPPKQYIKEKDREEENPLDPTYLEEVEDVNRLRGLATMQAMIMFGIELVDGVPDPDGWLPKLKWLERLVSLDLDTFDLEDPMDLEMLYKMYVAVGGVDLMMVTIKSGMSNEEVASAMDGFRSIQASGSDNSGDAEVQSLARDHDES